MAHNNDRKIERTARMAEWVREERDRAWAVEVIDVWNAKLAEEADPLFFPAIRAALLARRPWLIVLCQSCDLVIDLDLRVKPRPPEATVAMAFRDIRCPRCNGHGRPKILRLAEWPSR
jgi:hypothetical protein